MYSIQPKAGMQTIIPGFSAETPVQTTKVSDGDCFQLEGYMPCMLACLNEHVGAFGTQVLCQRKVDGENDELFCALLLFRTPSTQLSSHIVSRTSDPYNREKEIVAGTLTRLSFRSSNENCRGDAM